MNNIYAVRIKKCGRPIYIVSNDEYNADDYVVIECSKGIFYSKVINKIENIDYDNDYSILRIANEADKSNYESNLIKARESLSTAIDIAKDLQLEMSLLDATFSLDRKQLLFTFTADERVDFRELAKSLASIYKTRIELRQIGIRDKAKEISGLGPCGRELCCSTFLNKLDSISMNMAKNQNIALNPNKINGSCGRLLCCLTYEDDEYEKCQKGLPFVGQTVKTKNGSGVVYNVDVLSRKYKVNVDGEKVEIKLDEE